MINLNPRWDAWRIAHPNAPTYEFPLWNREQMRHAAKDIPEAMITPCGYRSIVDHDAYDEWLFRTVAPYWAA